MEAKGSLAVLRCFRGFGKSTLLAIYNAWRYYKDPTDRILHQSESDPTAYKTSRDTQNVIRNHPQRVAHVHCKDVRWENFAKAKEGGSSFLDGVLSGMFTVPGDGGLDYAEIMRALKAIDYSGWIVIEAEQDPKLADPRIYAALGLKTLKDEAEKAGLT